jgi:hypothetical protein
MNTAMQRLTATTDGMLAFLPALLAGILILAAGAVVGFILARITRALLGRIGYDGLVAKLGLIDRPESRAGSRWTGTAVFWAVMLAAAMQTARTWHLEMVATGVSRLIGYLPHLVGAVVIFGAALYFGDWVRDRIARGESRASEMGQRPLVGASVRAGILTMGAFMALRELQIAPEIVTIAFTLTLAAIALSAALAFGLGSRAVAEQVTQRWYERRNDGAKSAGNGAGIERGNGVKTDGVAMNDGAPTPAGR